MKNIIISLLLLPFVCVSQTILLNDTTYNMSFVCDSFSGEFNSSVMSAIDINSMSNTTNDILINELDGTITVSRLSKVSIEGSLVIDLSIVSTSVVDSVGVTYTVYDYYNGVSGVLFIRNDGMVIFSREKVSYHSSFLGFIGFGGNLSE